MNTQEENDAWSGSIDNYRMKINIDDFEVSVLRQDGDSIGMVKYEHCTTL